MRLLAARPMSVLRDVLRDEKGLESVLRDEKAATEHCVASLQSIRKVTLFLACVLRGNRQFDSHVTHP
jgi:hypothetical protein